MSDVVNTIVEEFIVEKAHLQKFLNYLAARPYHEVVEIIETMKLARVYTPPNEKTPDTTNSAS